MDTTRILPSSFLVLRIWFLFYLRKGSSGHSMFTLGTCWSRVEKKKTQAFFLHSQVIGSFSWLAGWWWGLSRSDPIFLPSYVILGLLLFFSGVRNVLLLFCFYNSSLSQLESTLVIVGTVFFVILQENVSTILIFSTLTRQFNCAFINVTTLDTTWDWLLSRSTLWRSICSPCTSTAQICHACFYAHEAVELQDTQIRGSERIESLVRWHRCLHSTLGAPPSQAELRAATNLTDG